MKKISLILPLLLAACSSSDEKTVTKLEAPAQLTVSAVQDVHTSALLRWKDNCEDESGYYVFAADPAASGTAQPVAQLPGGSESYLFENLTEGQSYLFGVQAFGADNTFSDRIYAAEPWTVTKPVDPKPDDPKPDDPKPDPNPVDPITFQWTEVTGLGLPAEVSVYKTEDKLNDRAFNAWYAVADPGEVDLRVLFPGKGVTRTLDQQAEAADGCLVLINGGIFGSTGEPIGFAICDGTQTPWREVPGDGYTEYVDKQAWGAVPNSAYNRLHPVSRGMFGVDREGLPGVYWSYTPSYRTVYVYDEPIPTEAGEPVHPEGSPTYPCDAADWTPYNALTCGPVLLKDGRCPINDKKNAAGYWMMNYELWADDIFGVDQRADRTAVGYTAEGKVILLICDGRITASQGATTLEMAAIMKGLGCVGALNLDGGGSTGMWAGGQHLNDLTGGNRPLVVTVGFFKK